MAAPLVNAEGIGALGDIGSQYGMYVWHDRKDRLNYNVNRRNGCTTFIAVTYARMSDGWVDEA